MAPHPDRPTTAVLAGAERAAPASAIPAIAAALMRQGFDRVRWRRIKGSRDRWVEFDLAKLLPPA